MFTIWTFWSRRVHIIIKIIKRASVVSISGSESRLVYWPVTLLAAQIGARHRWRVGRYRFGRWWKCYGVCRRRYWWLCWRWRWQWYIRERVVKSTCRRARLDYVRLCMWSRNKEIFFVVILNKILFCLITFLKHS